MLDNLHVEQIARGNRVAFKELHEELYGRMFYYVYKMLHDKEQSEDIIQALTENRFILGKSCEF